MSRVFRHLMRLSRISGMEHWNGLVSAKNLVTIYKINTGLVMKIISRGTNLQDRAKDAILSLAITMYLI